MYYKIIIYLLILVQIEPIYTQSYFYSTGNDPYLTTDIVHLKEVEHPEKELFQNPISGSLVITSRFGHRFHPVSGQKKKHLGIDIRAKDKVVYPIDDGMITAVKYSPVLGISITIQHSNGYQSVYGHLDRINVLKNTAVSPLSPIGRSGSTGNVTGEHLHLTIKKDGTAIDPEPLLHLKPHKA